MRRPALAGLHGCRRGGTVRAMTEQAGRADDQRPVVIRIGNEELIVRRRYEVASIVHDLLIAVWFVVGSVLFFSPETETVGTWLFLLGSIELLIRPIIRLSRRVHLRRFSGDGPTEAAHDF
ncbi:YrhK-like protein [Prauserella sp. Am3]|nr:YrhK-like protein [Prauserella sp. Am3]